MQKIAAIDIGSNAIRMIVGRITDSQQVETLENIRLPVRLGQDVFNLGKLQESTIQQAIEAFQHFRRVADDFEVTRIRAIATSAMREASNGYILIDRIAQAAKISIDVISGDEEARLIHRAVSDKIKLDGKRAVLIDIGGGSVEVTISENGNIVSTESYNMGTVRLLQQLDGGEKSGFSLFQNPKRPFAMLVREYAEAARKRIDREIGREKVDLCIGTGGNVEEIGKLRQKLLKQNSAEIVRLGELQELIEQINDLSVKDRIRKLKLRPDRADVILPAAIVLQLIARETGAKQIHIPNVGLKDGLLAEIADEIAQGPQPPKREQVWSSAARLGDKYEFDAEHATLVAKLAGQLFDQTKELHHLEEEERLLLEIGALLHDVGHFINTLDHDKHGYYILKANSLIGLSARQQEIVANLVRYHRKFPPTIEDAGFKSLASSDRLMVTKLSALIRLADGMDISHTRHVRNVTLVRKKKRWELSMQGKGELLLERWGLNKRRALFQEIFGVELEIV
ncbi:MAG: Ppx/GppA family phosphatase [Anaerolineales bacterium]|nr:Ppx/GppA family phosphatase [Anaerolineales bacterium]